MQKRERLRTTLTAGGAKFVGTSLKDARFYGACLDEANLIGHQELAELWLESAGQFASSSPCRAAPFGG